MVLTHISPKRSQFIFFSHICICTQKEEKECGFIGIEIWSSGGMPIGLANKTTFLDYGNAHGYNAHKIYDTTIENLLSKEVSYMMSWQSQFPYLNPNI